MTADYVAYHAAERPAALAVLHNGRALSFVELDRDIRRAMDALGALGVRPGGSVAVSTDDLYLHWLLLLACERLGIAAASVGPGEASLRELDHLWASVDMVLTAPDIVVAGTRRYQALTPSWIEDALAGAPPGDMPAPRKMPNDPVRIVRTSGTTGLSKRFLVTRRMHDALSAEWQWGFALGPRCRYLQTLSLLVRATFDLGSACLRAGGTLVLESRMQFLDAISAHAITHAIVLPIHLKASLDRLPPDFTKPPELAIVSFGAALSDALRARAMARLATSICDLYGTVEVSIASAIWRPGTDGVGTVWPGVRVEAVDERGTVVPRGEMGRLRIKTGWMSLGYLDDPETTARMFRDGWFYPGDVAVIGPGGGLKILGRADDLINIGGKKFLPAVLEDLLMKHAIAGDVGVSSLPGADGVEELRIAVAGAHGSDQELIDRILEALRRFQVGHFKVVQLGRIPRSANGKLQRQELRDEIARLIDSR
ncbi:MAG TPA: class I adenylate-forming enzyme family protein [Stellaceae bacterium]|nr:class I adenylate-forming enzyme family protein [Stellaceae bacterium]